jgi:hypothetical protein
MVEGGDVAGGNDEPHVQLVDAHRVERLQGHHVEHLVHRVVRPHHADVFHHAKAREKNCVRQALYRTFLKILNINLK